MRRLDRSRARTWLFCLAWTCVGALALPWQLDVAAQSPAAVEYLALIAQYQSGDTVAAARALGDHEDRWVESAQGAIFRASSTWPRSRVAAAVLLHTDVVVGEWVLPSHVQTHLNAARRFLDLSRGTMVSQPFRRDWLIALSWYFQSIIEFRSALPFVDELRARFPDDGEALLTTGTLYEAIGWTESFPADLTVDVPSRTLSSLKDRSQRQALESAASAYRRAADVPSSHIQATVRLGRVLTELNRAYAARDLLRSLVDDGTDRRWPYLAALFTAAAESRLGNPEAAASAYEHAAALMPGCQTPLVGLTGLRRLQGDTEEAADLARRLTTLVTFCDDPWWFYRRGATPDRVQQLLEDMRGAMAP